ncbi:MAG: protein TolA [Pseudomonadota bacterium]|nr:protein TolA [Pseudomonadota bacterium]
MRTGLTISAVGHLALIAWGLVSFAAKPFDSNRAEALPIDIITAEQFSKVTAGQKDAKKTPQPKLLVEKIAEAKPAENPAPKIADKKKEIQPSAEPKPAPESKPEKAEMKAPELKVDQIAEALKKDEGKKPLMEKAETPVPPRKPAPPQPKFDASQVAALLDKRTPQRQAAAGSTLNSLATLGLANADAATLSQSELDALRARLAKLWNPPIGIRKPEDFIVRIQVRLGRDGKLSAPPMVVTSGKGTEFESARDSAVRALYQGQPFDMLRPETYDVWQDMEITFDPREMFRG